MNVGRLDKMERGELNTGRIKTAYITIMTTQSRYQLNCKQTHNLIRTFNSENPVNKRGHSKI